MRNKRKISFIAGIITLVIAISAFTTQPVQEDNKPKNLKVLSKKISDEELTKVMRGFNAALGVKCGYCHAPKANGEKGMDFASDANPKKDIARQMIKMTNKINKKYFNKEYDGAIKNIACETCHNGAASPKVIQSTK
ncbi:c-type cytochrome [Sphingobacterium bovistauri]|uniref:Photosynthetic reaction center cytochrome c subunit n=1 Tax=Sphingobacterium bovistauri TaxID=2781959 RepID=A0ABS7Z067_9SPHI|nr:c-type cytochrome [Sphingobacterium bovistauri]MCA5003526.1 c-type cytochrome [Sphingobacterium bovistauri]